MKVVYVAHRLNAPTRAGIDQNRRDASRWVGWLAEQFPIAPVADWIVLTGVWTEEMRERGLAIDLALIDRCDEVWMVGPAVSSGMKIEAEHAVKIGKPVRDLTGFVEPTEKNSAPLAAEIAARVGFELPVALEAG